MRKKTRIYYGIVCDKDRKSIKVDGHFLFDEFTLLDECVDERCVYKRKDGDTLYIRTMKSGWNKFYPLER